MKAPKVVLLALAILLFVSVTAARAGRPGVPAVAVQWVVADVMENGSEDWKPGMGFNLSGSLPVGRVLDLRADWGGRWLEGESRLITDPNHEPRWGGQAGETTEALRVMPATLDLVCRLEGVSMGRYWVPYVGAGPGMYDLRATFADADAAERDHSLFRFGWHVRAGALLHRTSGLHLSLETAVHFIDTPGKLSPMWEAGLGLGTIVTGRTR
jgi:hypothetical protein